MSILLDLYRFCRSAPAHPIQAAKELTASRWARFAIIGFAASVTYYLFGLLLVNICKLNLLFGNAVAFIISFAVSYLGQARWTFQSSNLIRETLPKFAAIQLVALFFNGFIIDFLCRKVHLPYPLAMLAAIAIVPVAVYVTCKFWVFRKK